MTTETPELRLVDLQPRWVGINRWSSDRPFHIGVSFLCPHCRQQRLAALFDPVIDPTNVAPETTWTSTATVFPGCVVWARLGGETFESISLAPSIDAGFAGHWHGFITNGEII
jgi:hypothetical protein